MLHTTIHNTPTMLHTICEQHIQKVYNDKLTVIGGDTLPQLHNYLYYNILQWIVGMSFRSHPLNPYLTGS